MTHSRPCLQETGEKKKEITQMGALSHSSFWFGGSRHPAPPQANLSEKVLASGHPCCHHFLCLGWLASLPARPRKGFLKASVKHPSCRDPDWMCCGPAPSPPAVSVCESCMSLANVKHPRVTSTPHVLLAAWLPRLARPPAHGRHSASAYGIENVSHLRGA